METFETPTKTIKITHDDYPYNPRKAENLGLMICSHRRYNLGDKHDIDFSNYNSFEEVEKAIKNKYKTAIILPLYLYDHSGITISTKPFGCPWDSGQIGFITISKDKIRSEYGVKRITKDLLDRVEGCLVSEVKLYDYYLMGEVYHFEITDKEGNVLDSCGGFLGSDYNTNGILDYIDDEELIKLLK